MTIFSTTPFTSSATIDKNNKSYPTNNANKNIQNNQIQKNNNNNNNYLNNRQIYNNQNNRSSSVAPFNSTQKRFQNYNSLSQSKSEIYDMPFQSIALNHQKVILNIGTNQQKIAIIQYPKLSSNFKSSTKRFQNSINIQNPGPGSYFGLSQKKKSTMIPKQKIKSLALIKYIKQFRSQQQHNKNQFDKLLSSNVKVPRYNQSTQKKNLKKKDKSKPNLQHFFNSNVPRIKPERPLTSVGPGQYQLNKTIVQRNLIVNKSIKQEKKQVKNDQDINKKNPAGFYYSQQIISSFVKKPKQSLTIQCFGTTASRFSQNAKNKNSIISPGPGYYESDVVSVSRPKTRKATKRQIRFGSQQEKDKNPLNNLNNQISFQQQKNLISNTLLQNQHCKVNFNKSRVIVSFGSTVQRFSQEKHTKNQFLQKQQINLQLYPDNVIQQNEIYRPFSQIDDKKKKKGINFNNRCKKTFALKHNKNNEHLDIIKKFDENRPHCYDSHYKTIEKQNLHQEKNNVFQNKDFIMQNKSNTHQKFTLFLNKNNDNNLQKNLQISKEKKNSRRKSLNCFKNFVRNQQTIKNVGRIKTESQKSFKRKTLGDQKIENILKIKYNTSLMKSKSKQNWSHQKRDPFKPIDASFNISPGQYNTTILGKKSFNKLCLR